MNDDRSEREKVILCWSSGKDSAWALHLLRGRSDLDVVGLLTVIDRARARVPMHDVRVELLRRQAAVAGLPLTLVEIPSPCSDEEYATAMREAIAQARGGDVRYMAFGDLYLEGIRAYRESRLEGTGLTALFPLWGLPTDRLAREMVAAGLRARITSIDAARLDPSFLGRELDDEFLDDLPDGVDHCGERGEFHSFVTAGPMFSATIDVMAGDRTERAGFLYLDIEPIGDWILQG